MTPRVAAPALLAALLTACTVGPDFHRPTTASPNSLLTLHPQSSATYLVETNPEDDWWTSFNDPVLTSLEQRAASQNLDVQTASARLEQAGARRRITGAGMFPSTDATASYAHSRTNPNGPNAVVHNGSANIDVFDGGFQTSWELDFWGRVRRSVEAAGARYDVAENFRRLALLLVEAEVARDYVALRGSQAQLAVLKESLGIARNSVALSLSAARLKLLASAAARRYRS